MSGFFEDVSHLITDNEPMLGYGACVFDADGDGRDEVFVCGFGDSNRLLKWDGRRLVDLCREDPAFAPLADAGRMSIGCCAADLDGDGREELYVLTSEVFAGSKKFSDRLFSFDNGAWRDLFEDEDYAAVMNLVSGRSVAAIDRHGEGRYGFLLATYGGPSVLFEMDAHGRLFDMAEPAGLRFVAGGRSLLTGPLFGKGGEPGPYPDVFCGNEGGANFAFIRGADGVYGDHAAEMGLADPSQHARGVAVAGVAGRAASGPFALALANWEGPSRLWIPRGSTAEGLPTFANVAPPELASPARARSALVCDFDHDGFDELFIHNIGHANGLYRLGSSAIEPLDPGDAGESNGMGTGAVWCDVDGDGVVELLLIHGELARQPLTLMRPAEVGGGARTIRPLTKAGAPARHAVVGEATAEDPQEPRLWRLVDAGSGYLCQMSPEARLTRRNGGEAQVLFPGGVTVELGRDRLEGDQPVRVQPG